jgi:hypothetical protein
VESRDRLGLCWKAEVIADVHRRVDLYSRGVHAPTEDHTALWIHRNDPVSPRLEIARFMGSSSANDGGRGSLGQRAQGRSHHTELYVSV